MLDVPFGDAEFLRRSVETMTAAHLGQRGTTAAAEAYIRILLTRGIGELTYDPAATPVPSVVVIVKPLAVPAARDFENGVKVCMVDIIRNHPQSVNPIIKSNNLLNNALCMQQAMRQRWRRRRVPQLPRRAVGMFAVESLHRQTTESSAHRRSTPVCCPGSRVGSSSSSGARAV